MFIAPAVMVSTSVSDAVTFAAIFSIVTFAALMISSLLPGKIPYALRIILYTAIAAAVYVPVYMLLDGVLPSELSRLGVFLPLIVTGEFVVSAAELRFFRLSPGRMTADIISHIIGFDTALIFLSFVRELFATGGINGELYGIRNVIPVLSAPCGGFILIGIMGALTRVIFGKKRS